MNRLHRLHIALMFNLAFLAGHAIAAAPEVPAFSRMKPGDAVTGWQTLKPAPNANDTRYSLVPDAGTVVLKAEAESAMSGLIHPVRVDIRRTPLLCWRWKVADIVAVALATDTDNTGESANAWYGDIEFLPASRGETR
jgi:hypothetical protein